MKLINFWTRSASRRRRHSQGSLAGHRCAFRDARTATVAIALCLAACSGDDTDVTDGAGASTTVDQADDAGATAPDASLTAADGPTDEDDSTASTTAAEVVPGCECIVDEDDAKVEGSMTVPSDPTCGDALCANVSGVDSGIPGEGKGLEFALSDPAALECALTALRDRTPGVITWYYGVDAIPGKPTPPDDEYGYILVTSEGTAVRRMWEEADLSYLVGDAVLGDLAASETFEACLAEPDDRLRFDCMRMGLASELAICDEGWEFDTPI